MRSEVQHSIEQLDKKIGQLRSDLSGQAFKMDRANHNIALLLGIQKQTDRATSAIREAQANLTLQNFEVNSRLSAIHNLLLVVAKRENLRVYN
jgi:hypothetical protein